MSKRHDQGFKNFMSDPNRIILSGQVDLNGLADDAVFTLAAPAGSDRDVTIQLKEGVGDDLVDQGNGLIGTAVGKPNVGYAQSVELHVFLDAAGLAYAATGGSTGIVDIGAGDLLAAVAKKVFFARSDAAGLLEVRWTDTLSEVAFLGVKLPSGRVVVSGALTI